MAPRSIGDRSTVITCLRLLPAVALVLLAGTASAQTTGSSSAYGASVAANLVPLLGGGIPISLGPLPVASGTAPGPYAESDTEASILLTTGLTGQILATGLLEASASSEIPNQLATSSNAVIDGLDVRIVGSLVTRLLTLSATTVASTASVDGACGALVATGASVIEDGQAGGLLGAGLAIPSNPTPNFVLLDALGIRIVLNEQSTTGNGSTTRGISVNAIHIELDVSLLGIGALSGDIVIGHSEAEVQCSFVPTATPSPSPSPVVFTPTPGGATPTPGGTTPTPGGATPTPAGATPTPGGATPTPGGATPTAGPSTPSPTPAPTAEPPPPTPTPLPGDPGDDPYTDEDGLAPDGLAGATLNPNGIGQLLYGTLYDVRPVAGAGGTDAQNVNLRITNTQPIGAQNGGVLVRVRFRDSAASREVYAFDVALSCGEDWAGMVYLNGGGLPAIRSVMPIVSGISSSQVTTAPSIDPANGGAPGVFSVPAGATADDVRRGYFEVIATEQLPCEPIEPGGFSREGNTFQRLSGAAATPPNSLAGQVILIRPAAGASFAYSMPAIARFVVAGGGSIWAPVGSGLPDVGSCVGWDAEAGATYTGLPACLDQIDLVLSMARAHALYDVDPSTAAKTYLVVTLPTKGMHCPPGNGVGAAPFRCSPTGERIGCRVFDREENELLPSPSCNLPREMSFLEIGGSGTNARADARIGTGDFTSGWLGLSYASDPFAGGTGVHEHRDLDPATTSFIGVPADGFRGLPALTLVLQEYWNGNVGGSFGMMVEAPGEMEILGLER